MTTSTTKQPVTKPVYTEPRYIAASNGEWGVEMLGSDALDTTDDASNYTGIIGLPMTNFTIEGEGIKKARVRNKKGRWLGYSTGFDTEKGLGDGTAITGIEIVGKGFIFAIHLKGGNWLKPVTTSDVDGEILGGMGTPIDAIWIDKF